MIYTLFCFTQQEIFYFLNKKNVTEVYFTASLGLTALATWYFRSL